MLRIGRLSLRKVIQVRSCDDHRKSGMERIACERLTEAFEREGGSFDLENAGDSSEGGFVQSVLKRIPRGETDHFNVYKPCFDSISRSSAYRTSSQCIQYREARREHSL